ncbi:MAG TPA: Spy/CpxP family protein refolding chaperone [Albitalea sp.]|nr:Spy/CpxP family protein refolding chaperone [Albitalea sp.]
MGNAMTTNSTSPATARGIKWVLVGLAVAVSATLALSAWAQPGPGWHHGGGMDGPGMFMGGPGHMGHGMDHMLDGVGATDAQRAQIKQIFQQAAADLKGQRDAGRALHEKSLQIFTAPSVDAAAAESVRQQMLAQHDAASRRMLQAMLDAANVLTPEQRAKLGTQIKERQQRMQERMQQWQQRRDGAAPKQ